MVANTPKEAVAPMKRPNPQGKARLPLPRDKRVMEEQITVGDLVRFKGGGSPMIVEKIEGDDAICVFSLGGKQHLKLDVLEKVPDEPHWWDRG